MARWASWERWVRVDIDLIWGFRAFIKVFAVLVRIAIWEAIDEGVWCERGV